MQYFKEYDIIANLRNIVLVDAINLNINKYSNISIYETFLISVVGFDVAKLKFNKFNIKYYKNVKITHWLNEYLCPLRLNTLPRISLHFSLSQRNKMSSYDLAIMKFSCF